MPNIQLKDGTNFAFEGGTAMQLAEAISAGLARSALAAKIDGKVVDLSTPITKDCAVELLTFDSEEGKKVYNHTASHVLAQAVKRLYPEAKLAIGPAIENGFYYDIDSEISFSPEILSKLEDEMKKIIKENFPLERFTLPRAEAIALMTERNEPYKVQLIEELPEGEEISFYRQGEFTDLCAGAHIPSTGKLKAVKLTQCTGAYWKGDSKNKMLQRIYGIAFPKQSQLDEYLAAVEEAKKRDHNRLGRELELFTTVDYIGQGLPIMLPKGAKIIQLLQRWVEDTEYDWGWQLTKTPLMAKSDLYKISGHWDHYKEGMFVMGSEEDGKECFALRPMTCPFQYQAYLNRARSYRDLPMRLNETSTLFRNEDSGEMHGLIRVRQFTISEGHLMCTPDQLEDEFKRCLELTRYMLTTIGLEEDVTYRFSQWDPNDRAKYIGTKEQWDEAQGVMKRILDDIGIDYKIGIGEAAFYGPKLDIQIKNVHGKEDTLVTIQIDQMLAEKFGMEYVDKDGIKKHPYIIHRTSLGCYERTLALLIEKYAGAFPTWLSPTQVKILPISDSQKEADEGLVAVRSRKEGDKGAMPVDEFIDLVTREIRERTLNV